MKILLTSALCAVVHSVASAAIVTATDGAGFRAQSLPYGMTVTPLTLAQLTSAGPGRGKLLVENMGANNIEWRTVLRFSQAEIESLGPLTSAHLSFSVFTESWGNITPFTRTLRITGYSSDGSLAAADFSQAGNVIFDQTINKVGVPYSVPFSVNIASFLNGALATSDSYVAFRFEQVDPGFSSQASTAVQNIQLNVVPEPSAVSVLLAGFAVLGIRRIRR